jgi:tetratricopeptide (TPR) repeat protein
VIAALLLFLAAAPAYDDPLRAGLIALGRGDLAAAQASLEEASRAAPGDGRAWIGLAQVYWRQNRNADAEQAAGRAVKVAPEDAAVLQGLAIYYSETGRSLKAAQAQVKYAAKVPDKADARERAAQLYFDAARPLLDAQRFGDAVSILREATARLPNSAQLQLALGVACYGLRRFEEAADAFLHTIDLAPETEQPYTFLGKILDQTPSRLPEVTKRFAARAAAHPEDGAACLLHARALDAQSLDPAMALGLVDRSIRLNPAESAAYFERGIVLDRLQRFGEAAGAFERAVQLSPSDPAAHYRLARDYDRIGKPEAAQAEREKHAQLVKSQ